MPYMIKVWGSSIDSHIYVYKKMTQLISVYITYPNIQYLISDILIKPIVLMRHDGDPFFSREKAFVPYGFLSAKKIL